MTDYPKGVNSSTKPTPESTARPQLLSI